MGQDTDHQCVIKACRTWLKCCVRFTKFARNSDSIQSYDICFILLCLQIITFMVLSILSVVIFAMAILIMSSIGMAVENSRVSNIHSHRLFRNISKYVTFLRGFPLKIKFNLPFDFESYFILYSNFTSIVFIPEYLCVKVWCINLI